MIISVASGKGGTGKTTIAVNLALSLSNVQLLDCDVEEPNAALFLNPIITEKISAIIPVPVIDQDKCSYCGKCREVCEYNAIAVMSKTDKNRGNILFFPKDIYLFNPAFSLAFGPFDGLSSPFLKRSRASFTAPSTSRITSIPADSKA